MEIGQNFKNLPVKYLVLWCLGVPSGSSLTPWRVFKISSNFNFLCSKKRRVAARSLATGSQRPLVARLMHWVLKNLWRGHEVSKVSFFELFGIKFTKICTFGHFCLFQPWDGTLSPYCLFHQFLLPTKILEESMGDRQGNYPDWMSAISWSKALCICLQGAKLIPILPDINLYLVMSSNFDGFWELYSKENLKNLLGGSIYACFSKWYTNQWRIKNCSDQITFTIK